jgi:hypothetical protein
MRCFKCGCYRQNPNVDFPLTRKGTEHDYPLPGTFPTEKGTTSGYPYWAIAFEKKAIYPGITLSELDKTLRNRLIDEGKLQSLAEFDALLGYNPVFELQYELLNPGIKHYLLGWGFGSVVFEANGKKYAAHYSRKNGFKLNGKIVPRSQEPDDIMAVTYDEYISDIHDLIEVLLKDIGEYPVITNVRFIERPGSQRSLFTPEAQLRRFGIVYWYPEDFLDWYE